MKMIKEFKEFISRGNVLDMAIGIIIGSAFTAIVSSLVNDVIMPLIGFLFGSIDFSAYKITLIPASEGSEGVFLRYGAFIQTIVNFLLIAICIFIVIKQINKLKNLMSKKEEEKKEPKIADDIKLLTEIRDLLSKANDTQTERKEVHGEEYKERADN